MKEITWGRMYRLEKADVVPFIFGFDLLNPTTEDDEICFGTFRVQDFNYYRDGKLENVTIYADGNLCTVVTAEKVFATCEE